jgi:hypothetical protein
MLNLKTNPVGIDWYVQQLQKKLHTALLAKWEITDSKYECYGRCYRNKKDNGYVAEVYTSGNDYKEVYWNDTLAAISFFGISNNVKRGIKSEADVHLVFFLDLSKAKPGITHRGDEEVRQDVINIIGNTSFGFNHLSTELWLENVLREYAGSYRDQRLRAVDMHPVHCFRINLKLLFDQNKIC